MKKILIIIILLISFPAFSAEEIFTYQNTPLKKEKAAQAKLQVKYFPYQQADPEKILITSGASVNSFGGPGPHWNLFLPV